MKSVSFRFFHSLSMSVMTVPYLKAGANCPSFIGMRAHCCQQLCTRTSILSHFHKSEFQHGELLQGPYATYSLCLSNLFLLLNISPITFRYSTISIQPMLVIYAFFHFLTKAIANTHLQKKNLPQKGHFAVVFQTLTIVSNICPRSKKCDCHRISGAVLNCLLSLSSDQVLSDDFRHSMHQWQMEEFRRKFCFESSNLSQEQFEKLLIAELRWRFSQYVPPVAG